MGVSEVEHLILGHLRALRAGQERLEEELRELRYRMTSLEGAMAGLRRDVVTTQEDLYRQ